MTAQPLTLEQLLIWGTVDEIAMHLTPAWEEYRATLARQETREDAYRFACEQLPAESARIVDLVTDRLPRRTPTEYQLAEVKSQLADRDREIERLRKVLADVMGPCCCRGPQDGAPACPCQMMIWNGKKPVAGSEDKPEPFNPLAHEQTR
jgi:hypothetical protein